MAKLKSDPIEKSDLIDFLDNHSDFSFELEVLNALINKGFSCEHGGSYTDRTTGKNREFDIRATQVFGKCFLRLAIECKNLRPNFPLLVSCVPRREDEAFHEILISVDPEKNPLEKAPEIYGPAMLRQSKNIRLTDKYTFYESGKSVGKECNQVGRSPNGEIIAGDADVYTKWSQALSSADDLIYLACLDGNDRTGDIALSLVFPVLVVPNDRLWLTQYDSDGKRIKDPHQIDRCSYFVNLSYYNIEIPQPGGELTISHLEFVTLKGLLAFVDEISGSDDKLNANFPYEYVIEQLYS